MKGERKERASERKRVRKSEGEREKRMDGGRMKAPRGPQLLKSIFQMNVIFNQRECAAFSSV